MVGMTAVAGRMDGWMDARCIGRGVEFVYGWMDGLRRK